MNLLQRVEALEAEIGAAVAANADEVERFRVAMLGRNGQVTALFDAFKTVPAEEKRQLGQRLNQLKQAAQAKWEDLKAAAGASTSSGPAVTDPTRPAALDHAGSLHPISLVRDRIVDVFARLGYTVSQGPEVEDDHHNFSALNFPPDHPARDMWDTIWVNTLIDGKRHMLLRTHTSPNQVRVLERTPAPPVRVVVPGKCYRQEATDATHEWMLTQIEGLAVDEGVRMSDLKGVLYEWSRQMFGHDRKIIFHHSYFPFVEPGVEMAIDCFICRGNGKECRTCHGTGWIEILGAGMVHPEIIETAGYDSSKVTGFAFGIGVERVALLRWGIEDIRNFYANDIRFLSQF